MNLEQYEQITGKTLTGTQATQTNRYLQRSVRSLEKMLGYTLNPDKTNTNIYNETGKLPHDNLWSYPIVDTSLSLLPPDDVVGAYRLYRYNPYDKYFYVDPFTAVNAVKLVYIKPGYPEDGSITVHTFDPNYVRPQYGKDGLGKFIENNYRFWWENYQHLQLAVDADWAFQDCLPDELIDLIIDMTDYYNGGRGDIMQETIEGHEYRKFLNARQVPQELPENVAAIKQYAGPYGAASWMPTE